MKNNKTAQQHRMAEEGVCKLGIKHPGQLTFLCPEGIKRARWMAENYGASAAEELSAPGCSFFALSEDVDCYCFFKMLDNKDGRLFSEEEIARRLGLTLAQVRSIINRAILKIKGTEYYEEMKDLRDSGELYSPDIDEDDDTYCTSGGSFSEGIETAGEATEVSA